MPLIIDFRKEIRYPRHRFVVEYLWIVHYSEPLQKLKLLCRSYGIQKDISLNHTTKIMMSEKK